MPQCRMPPLSSQNQVGDVGMNLRILRAEIMKLRASSICREIIAAGDAGRRLLGRRKEYAIAGILDARAEKYAATLTAIFAAL